MVNKISLLVTPILILFILIYAMINKINIYESFIKGCNQGLKICYEIFPSIVAMVFAVNIFYESNFLSMVLSPVQSIISIPLELISMAILRPISGNASMALMLKIFNKYGVDSYLGNLSSIIQGCTDTTIYVIALYYSYVKVKKTRYTITVGLLADLVGIIMGFILTSIFF